MATTPAQPAPELPQIQKPKLSGFQKRTINNALEGAQEWVAANEAAIVAQTHALLDRVIATVRSSLDTALTWATTKFATLKL